MMLLIWAPTAVQAIALSCFNRIQKSCLVFAMEYTTRLRVNRRAISAPLLVESARSNVRTLRLLAADFLNYVWLIGCCVSCQQKYMALNVVCAGESAAQLRCVFDFGWSRAHVNGSRKYRLFLRGSYLDGPGLCL
mmetsp:Transcript_7722/g.11476  ORF Transcript_7722/g.11476 Transcript_7722/m.11476 type:complete len:135 (-) Transcript_7722:226-630(-)